MGWEKTSEYDQSVFFFLNGFDLWLVESVNAEAQIWRVDCSLAAV